MNKDILFFSDLKQSRAEFEALYRQAQKTGRPTIINGLDKDSNVIWTDTVRGLENTSENYLGNKETALVMIWDVASPERVGHDCTFRHANIFVSDSPAGKEGLEKWVRYAQKVFGERPSLTVFSDKRNYEMIKEYFPNTINTD